MPHFQQCLKYVTKSLIVYLYSRITDMCPLVLVFLGVFLKDQLDLLLYFLQLTLTFLWAGLKNLAAVCSMGFMFDTPE